jgi:hypothetical protein
MEEEKMKKWFLVIMAGLFFSGCAAMTESEFWKHDSMYKNWDHTKYSLGGYQQPTADTAKQSKEQGWWGIPTPK